MKTKISLVLALVTISAAPVLAGGNNNQKKNLSTKPWFPTAQNSHQSSHHHGTTKPWFPTAQNSHQSSHNHSNHSHHQTLQSQGITLHDLTPNRPLRPPLGTTVNPPSRPLGPPPVANGGGGVTVTNSGPPPVANGGGGVTVTSGGPRPSYGPYGGNHPNHRPNRAPGGVTVTVSPGNNRIPTLRGPGVLESVGSGLKDLFTTEVGDAPVNRDHRTTTTGNFGTNARDHRR